MTQSHALNILKMGRNVFLTGPAGSGKTYVLNSYIKYLREHGVSVGITASTGIAATHMGGMTIHSWAGIGIKDYMSETDLAELAEKGPLVKRFKETDVLIIDEVSMLHHFRLDILDKVARYLRSHRKLFDDSEGSSARAGKSGTDWAALKDKPFGGMQIILCGDFFQLPPVSRAGEPDARFVYHSQAWKDAGFTICYLEENYRQGTDPSTLILNEIRSGEVSEGSREMLQSRFRAELVGNLEPTQLFTHNMDVDSLNDRELKKVDEVEFVYEMTSRGKKNLTDYLKKSCLAPEVLKLKKGARVMCVKNNFEQGYVNGTLGVVVSCGPGVDPVIRTADDEDVTIEQATWQIEEDGKVLAEIRQYPIRLAWAITVHKSQGMSLDAVTVDLSRCFEPGMGYVALSRVRTLQGLVINGFNETALMVHPEVLDFDRHLRELSEKAESIIEYSDSRQVADAHREFIVKVAPYYSARGSGMGDQQTNRNSKKVKSQREPKISTFHKTLPLIRAEKTLSEMAAERKLASETIISHIEYLVGAGDLSVGEISYLKKEISPRHFMTIEKVLDEATDIDDDSLPFLSPIKSKVGPNISFKEIRLARVLLGYVKKNELQNHDEQE